MRGFIVWALAVLAWNLILAIGRSGGVHPTTGELIVVGFAGVISMAIIAAGDKS